MTAYPLSWPDGWKRTQGRTSARFSKRITKYRQSFADPAKHESYTVHGEVTITEGTTRVLAALQAMDIPDYHTIISSNLTLRLDGLPRGGQSEPSDPGVAVYWKRKGHQQVMAIDQYDRVADNLAAIAATLEALRAIQRHGGGTILDRAFTGFVALPEPNNWRHVLGLKDETATLERATAAYKKLAMARHPDKGGSHEQMAAINHAYDQARRELTA